MKKMYLICMVLFISLSTTMWTACSDDDDDPETDPTEEPTQPGDSTTVVTPTYDTTFLITKISIPSDMEGFYTQYTITRDDNNQISSLKMEEMTPEGTSQRTIDYEVTRGDNEINITYNDPFMGEAGYAFTLDEQGRVVKVIDALFYEGALDIEYPNYVYEFGYEGENLKNIDLVYEGESATILNASYTEDGNFSNIDLNIEGEEASIDCVASELENRYGIDLNMVFIGNIIDGGSSLLIANILGLIPITENILSEIGMFGNIVCDATNGVVESVSVEGDFLSLQLDLTTEMEVTEIEPAE